MHKLHLAAFEHGSWKGSVPDQTIQKQWGSEKKKHFETLYWLNFLVDGQ